MAEHVIGCSSRASAIGRLVAHGACNDVTRCPGWREVLAHLSRYEPSSPAALSHRHLWSCGAAYRAEMSVQPTSVTASGYSQAAANPNPGCDWTDVSGGGSGDGALGGGL